jgi:hypothetical protein
MDNIVHLPTCDDAPDPNTDPNRASAYLRPTAEVAGVSATRNSPPGPIAALDRPAIRLRVIQALSSAVSLETAKLALAVRYPTQTARRALEDLTAHGVVKRHGGGQGSSNVWQLSAWATRKISDAGIAFPEMSGDEDEAAFPEMSYGEAQ